MGNAIALRGGPFTCLYCNALTYIPNEGRPRSIVNPTWMHCGRPRCKRAHKAARVARYFRQYRQRTGERYQGRYDTPTIAYCSACGVRVNRHRRATRCGPCARAAHRHARLHREQARRTRTTVDVARIWTAGRCPRCGTQFTAASYSNPHRHCSQECKRAAARSRRRALAHGAVSTSARRYAVMERDNWTCQLCGGRLHRRRNVPHPKAPVIDHILPLTAGGDDAEHNWQSAHFICNSRKRDKAGPNGDQLRLAV